MTLTIYPDGGCEKGNGCWAFHCEETKDDFFGYAAKTTSNQMELTAIIKAIEYALTKEPQVIMLYSDSQYSVKGWNTWMHNWEKNGWCRRVSNWNGVTFEPVKNLDLWKRLFELHTAHGKKIVLRWIKGHAGNPGNERADELVKAEYSRVFGGTMTY